jgi:beta-phosphoglucomutase
MIKAVIFDMDGVLIDAKEWHYDALNKALNLFSFNISRYDHLVTYDGLPTKKKLEMLSEEMNLPRGLHSFINEMKQIYTMEFIYRMCKPVFHHEYALAKLKADGCKLAVCSNSVKATVDMMMEKSSLDKYLEFWLSNQDVAKSKPDPEIYQKAISMLGFKPHECLVLEDNKNGIESARRAGTHVLVIKNTDDVNYTNIKNEIDKINDKKSAKKHIS